MSIPFAACFKICSRRYFNLICLKSEENRYNKYRFVIEKAYYIKLTSQSVCYKMGESRSVLCQSEINLDFMHRLKCSRDL